MTDDLLTYFEQIVSLCAKIYLITISLQLFF